MTIGTACLNGELVPTFYFIGTTFSLLLTFECLTVSEAGVIITRTLPRSEEAEAWRGR